VQCSTGGNKHEATDGDHGLGETDRGKRVKGLEQPCASPGALIGVFADK